MGRYDSTKTRVTPVFDALCAQDPTGQGWLARLLALPACAGAAADRPITPPVLTPVAYGPSETLLPPDLSLLQYLVSHPERLRRPPHHEKTSPDTRAKREALLSADPASAQAEALELLATEGAPQRAWWVLEGHTHPDVYLETCDAVVVIEGKRTEVGATADTSWLRERDQMLRHLDAAWARLAGRRLFGFYIVESPDGLEVPPRWRAVCDATISDATLDASLPHRTPAERRAIADAFLGATTWQQVCATFGVSGVA